MWVSDNDSFILGSYDGTISRNRLHNADSILYTNVLAWMSNSWENFPKPWSQDIAADCYILGTKIGLRGLSQESGVPFSTLADWSRYDTPPWPVAAVIDEIADAAAELTTAHLKAWKNQRQLAAWFTEYALIILRCKESGEPIPEPVQKGFYFLMELGGRSPLATFTAALQVAIAGERLAANLDLLAPEVLEKYANKVGLTLVSFDEIYPENPPPHRIEIVALAAAAVSSGKG
jgi:hypothetical protein